MHSDFQPSPDQAKILEIQAGRHLVLAPPGAGKTELLAQRLISALDSGVAPEEMICLTFTNRAARNMQLRVENALGKPPPPELLIGNFHAFALRFLKRVGVFLPYHSVLDEEDSDLLLQMAADDLNSKVNADNEGTPSNPAPTQPSAEDELVLDEVEKHIDPDLVQALGMGKTGGPAEKRLKGFGRNIFAALRSRLLELIRPFANWNIAKQENLPGVVYQDSLGSLRDNLGYQAGIMRPFVWMTGAIIGALKMLFMKYNDSKATTRALDFDDLLLQTLKWLCRNPQSPYFQSYRWIQVDEAQDLNDTQWEILKRIVHPEACLLVFADPMQGIFSFMGAHPITFQKNVSDFSLASMSVNYRSPQYLLDLYKDYAKNNFDEKVEWLAATNDQPGPDDIVYGTTSDDASELEFIAQGLVPRLLREKGGKIAVLAKTNKRTYECSLALDGASIDHFVVSEYDLFRLRATKDFMAFLQILARPTSRLPWIRILAASDKELSLRASLDIVNHAYECGILPHWLLKGPGFEQYYPPIEITHLAQAHRLVVLDTETTGLDPLTSDIIQFAAVEIVKGKVGNSINLFLNTEKNIGESEAVHHISNEYLRQHGMDRAAGFKKILEFIGNSPIAAHNMDFDLSMLETNFQRTLGCSFRENRIAYCTLEVAVALDPDLPRHKLAYLIEQYGLKGANTHDALDDVKATAELVLYYTGQAEASYEKAKRFFETNHGHIQRVEKVFGATWRRLRDDIQGDIGLDDLYRVFRDLRVHEQYEQPHLKQVEAKLIRHMRKHTSPAPIRKLMDKYFEQYLLYKEPDLILEDDRVVVSTVHRAKGLEFDTVVVIDCHSNAYPSYYAAADPAKREEDARVLFVAMTRAKSSLIVLRPLTYITKSGAQMSVKISPFLEKVIHHFNDLRTGQKIIQTQGQTSGRTMHRCPKCGHEWPFDGSKAQDDRCFSCGHIPLPTG